MQIAYCIHLSLQSTKPYGANSSCFSKLPLIKFWEETQRRIISNSHLVTKHDILVQCNSLVHRHTSQLLALMYLLQANTNQNLVRNTHQVMKPLLLLLELIILPWQSYALGFFQQQYLTYEQFLQYNAITLISFSAENLCCLRIRVKQNKTSSVLYAANLWSETSKSSD